MKIHHLNCGSVRTIEATYAGLPPAHAVNHCLLVETDRDGLVLVETGLGMDNVRHPADTLGGDWVTMAQPVLAAEETAISQVERLGFAPADVRHVVVTHLDVDHCGGLPDFPDAAVHVMAAELDAAVAEAPSFRYRPAHWAHDPKWVTYELGKHATWFGLPALPLAGLHEDFLLVPLAGHTRGHAGVALDDGTGWLLHAGDAYYYHRELHSSPEPHPVLDVVQTRSEVDHGLRVASQAELRRLASDHGSDITIFSAHDPWELTRQLTAVAA